MGMGTCVSGHDKENGVSILVKKNGVSMLGKGGTVDRSCCVPHAEREHLCINQYRASIYKLESRKARGLIDFFRYL
jgi:hypothetical protein